MKGYDLAWDIVWISQAKNLKDFENRLTHRIKGNIAYVKSDVVLYLIHVTDEIQYFLHGLLF